MKKLYKNIGYNRTWICFLLFLGTALFFYNSCKKEETDKIEILFNTFAPNDTYTIGGGWTLGADFGITSVHAIGFIPEISGEITKYEIAVFRNEGGDVLNAWLLNDDNDYPGTTIEQFTFDVPSGTSDLMLSANSILHPLLAIGTRYWLVVAPPDINNELFGWYRNPSIEGVYNAQARSFSDSWAVSLTDYAPTLKITGYLK